MNKACASILIFVALFALVSAEDFQRIPLDQGRLRMRNLASSTYKSFGFNNYTNNTAVTVNLGSQYLASVGLNSSVQTDMLLFLYTNATGFCTNCNEFINFGCENNNCSADTTQPQTMLGPYYQVTTGYFFNFSNLTIGSDSTAWQLKTSALLHDYYHKNLNTIVMPGSNRNYFRNYTTYGYIGMGVGGNASKNFQTTTPIFSIQVNNSGVGSLIFGKDTTLYDSSRTAITLNTDTNWTMISRNMSLGPLINNTNYISSVVFDLQYPGIGLPYTYYYSIINSFVSKYNLTSSSAYGSTDYTYIFTGNLSSLPSLIFGLTNDKNITLPPSAYTKEVGTNLYAILFNYVDNVKNLTSTSNVNYTVLGWPVLSQFYTVFELPTTGTPTVTMYPTYDATANGMSSSSSLLSSSSGFSLKTLAIVAAVVLVVLVALSAICKKKQDFTKSDLGVELRAARV